MLRARFTCAVAFFPALLTVACSTASYVHYSIHVVGNNLVCRSEEATASHGTLRLFKLRAADIVKRRTKLLMSFALLRITRPASLLPTPFIHFTQISHRQPALASHWELPRMTSRRSARLSAAAATVDSIPDSDMPPPARPRKRKTVATEPQVEAPSTPRKRRAPQSDPAPPPPTTPTRSAVGTVADDLPVPRHAAVERIADPQATNAPLLSPETSRIIAPRSIESISSSQRVGITTTTANILEEACAHLIKIDARMEPLIKAHHCRMFSAEGLAERIDPFESLASGIISQQVSGAAAKSIKNRFVGLFNDAAESAKPDHDIDAPHPRFPHPSQVAATSLETLRTAGLSQRKAEYVQGLAAKFASGELSAQMLADASYEEVLEKLIAVRGLGRWSVEMFACFGLKRMDVFSSGDLGVQRGMAAFVGRDVSKLKSKGGKWKYMSEKEMEDISERFQPYRSVFMWYMWRVEQTDVSSME